MYSPYLTAKTKEKKKKYPNPPNELCLRRSLTFIIQKIHEKHDKNVFENT